MAKVTNF